MGLIQNAGADHVNLLWLFHIVIEYGDIQGVLGNRKHATRNEKRV